MTAFPQHDGHVSCCPMSGSADMDSSEETENVVPKCRAGLPRPTARHHLWLTLTYLDLSGAMLRRWDLNPHIVVDTVTGLWYIIYRDRESP